MSWSGFWLIKRKPLLETQVKVAMVNAFIWLSTWGRKDAVEAENLSLSIGKSCTLLKYRKHGHQFLKTPYVWRKSIDFVTSHFRPNNCLWIVRYSLCCSLKCHIFCLVWYWCEDGDDAGVTTVHSRRYQNNYSGSAEHYIFVFIDRST